MATTQADMVPLQEVQALQKQFLSADEFARLLGISKRTLFRLRATKAVPAPVEISTNTIRWRTRDVRACIDSLATRQPRSHGRHSEVNS